MSLFPVKNIKKKSVFLSLFLFLVFFVFSQGIFAQVQEEQNNSDTSVDKKTITFNISTVDYANWFDDRCTNGIDDDKDGKTDNNDSDCDKGARGLTPNLICDKDGNKSSGYMEPLPANLKYSPCDKDGVHDDYYSTSTANEADVWTSDKNFTVKVGASDFSGIDSIKIEWISGVSKKRDASGYWDPKTLKKYQKADKDLNPHKTSFTCHPSSEGKASCEICVVGGTCAHPVIPTGDLGISGTQQIILFRAVITDGAGNSIATGFDDTEVSPKLDKFYRFVVCSSSCEEPSCKNNNPEAELSGYDRKFSCEEPLLYTLKWKFKDKDVNDKPSSYILEARERDNPLVIYSAVRSAGDVSCRKTDSGTECAMSAILFKDFLRKDDGSSYNLEYNKNYDWRVKVYDNSNEDHCLGISGWSPWSSELDPSLSFATPSPVTPASFTMTNGSGKNCASGECKFLEDIKFTGTSETENIASYSWLIDGAKYGDKSSTTKNFPVGKVNYAIMLTVKDNQGISCSAGATLTLSKTDDPDNPKADKSTEWDEIAPGEAYGQ